MVQVTRIKSSPYSLRCGRFELWRSRWFTGAEKGEVVESNFSRRAFLRGLGLLSIPLIAFAQDREEKKKEAEEKTRGEQGGEQGEKRGGEGQGAGRR